MPNPFQHLYSKLSPNDEVPHLISKAEPGHFTQDAHFNCLYLGSHSFVHNQCLMTIDEVWNAARPVNQELPCSHV